MNDLLDGDGRLAEPVKVHAGMIRNHMAEVYSEANGYACLFEVANGTGSRVTNYADIVVVSLWPSRGYEITGYEVKVSRSDWQNELKQPDKAWPVMQYCDRWFLLSAPGVAKLDEVPLTWGWQEFDGTKLRVKKAGPALEAKPLSRSFIASMVRRPVRDIESMVKTAMDKKRGELEAEFKKRLEHSVSSRMSAAEDALKKIETIKEATGIDLRGWKPPEHAVGALKFALAADPFSRYGGVPDAIREVESALKSLQTLQSKLAEFTPAEAA